MYSGDVIFSVLLFTISALIQSNLDSEPLVVTFQQKMQHPDSI
jgi:hypothetical protein